MIDEASRLGIALVAKMCFFKHWGKCNLFSNKASQSISLLDHLNELVSDALDPEGPGCFEIVEKSKCDINI